MVQHERVVGKFEKKLFQLGLLMWWVDAISKQTFFSSMRFSQQFFLQSGLSLLFLVVIKCILVAIKIQIKSFKYFSKIEHSFIIFYLTKDDEMTFAFVFLCLPI